MTIEQIKELLSTHYLGTLASIKGFRVDRPFMDYGVDIVLERIATFTYNGKTRYFGSGQTVDVQLKCTTELGVERSPEYVKYDLSVKNYNDLVTRFELREEEKRSYIPLLLMVFVLPKEKEDWLELREDGSLIHRGELFWFYPDTSFEISENKSTKRIQIPINQKVNLTFFDELFNLLR